MNNSEKLGSIFVVHSTYLHTNAYIEDDDNDNDDDDTVWDFESRTVSDFFMGLVLALNKSYVFGIRSISRKTILTGVFLMGIFRDWNLRIKWDTICSRQSSLSLLWNFRLFSLSFTHTHIHSHFLSFFHSFYLFLSFFLFFLFRDDAR